VKCKVYSTPTCPFCKMAKTYLKQKGISYEDLDVSTDASARDEMIQESGQMGVPVIDFDGELVIGFDKEKLDSLIGRSQ